MPLSKIVAKSITDDTITTDQIADTSVHGRRNLVSNGAMLINQRGSVTAASGTALTYGGPDRWRIYKQDSTAVLNISQSTDVPSGQGFKYSYKVDVTTADSSVGADDRCDVIFRWEGQDLQHLKKGTSQAVTTTLQFWVKSSKTGTHICEMFDNDNTRQISKTYTVNTADTWEHKTITFEGDTTGAFAADNGNSMQISWWLLAGANTGGGTLSTTWTSNTQTNRAVGQVNVLDSTSNEWYITGVQLEVGDKATPFEHRSFGEEQQLCFRYYYDSKKANDNNGSYYFAPLHRYDSHQKGVTWEFATAQHPVRMRTAPTITLIDGDGNTGKISHWTTGGGNQTHNHNSYTTQAKEMHVTISDYNTSGIYGFYANYRADAEL